MGFFSSAKKSFGKVMGAADPISSAVLGNTIFKNSSVGEGLRDFSANIKAPATLENKLSTSTVKNSSQALARAGDAVGISPAAPQWVAGQADKDSDSMTRKWKNAALTAGALYGGYAALGGGSSGGGLAGMFGGSGGGGGGWLSGAGKYLGMANTANNLFGGGGSQGGGGMNLFNVLGGAYGANQQGKAAEDYKAWMDQRQAMNDNLYAPGSPEYNALWEEMSRKDAAAGRNSQYGPRSVDLASRIAQIKARENTAMTTGLSKGYSQALNQNAAKYSGLMGALGQGNSGGGGLMSLLGNMYGGGGSTDLSWLNDAMGSGSAWDFGGTDSDTIDAMIGGWY